MECITSKGCTIHPGYLWYHSFRDHMDLNMKFWWRKNWEKPYLYMAGIDMVFEPYLYLGGKEMVFWISCQQICICMKCITSKGCTIYPGYLWYHSLRDHMDFNMTFWREKNWEKPYLYMAGIDMVFEPYLYLGGKDMVFWIFCQQVCICMKCFTSNGCTINPGYL